MRGTKLLIAFLGMLVVMTAQSHAGVIVQWSIANGGNDHYYQLVLPGESVSWQQANAAANSSVHQGLPGHLLTVNSAAEHQFVESVWSSQFTNTGSSNATWAWIGLTDQTTEGVYEWVTGEPVTYTAWHFLEPNNWPGEDFVHYWLAVDGNSFSWNDSTSPAFNANNGLELGYFVEYESVSVPEPASVAIFSIIGLTILCGRRCRRPKRASGSIGSETPLRSTVFLCSVLICTISRAGLVVSDFDDGTLQGWSKYEPFGGTLTNPLSGGNGGGYLKSTDNVPRGGGLFAIAPDIYLGDLTRYAGIQWDEYVFVRGAGGSRTAQPTELFITGGSNPTTYRLANNPLEDIGKWQTRFVGFTASNFARSSAFGSGADPFERVLRSVSQVAFQMDTSTLANGGPEAGIDNVQLVPQIVPEPTSLLTFSVGLILLPQRRVRERQGSKGT